jgi:hypothetical protein
LEEDDLDKVVLDVWLYGALARYGGEAARPSYAHLEVALPAGCTVGDLLDHLHLPTAERGITFINGDLSAMPGLQPDLGHVLANSDRVAFFDLRSMWPFQYRHGAAMIGELADALETRDGGGLHHAYDGQSSA